MATSMKQHEKNSASTGSKTTSKTEPRIPPRYGQTGKKKPCRACTDFKSFAGSQGLVLPAGIGAAAAASASATVKPVSFPLNVCDAMSSISGSVFSSLTQGFLNLFNFMMDHVVDHVDLNLNVTLPIPIQMKASLES